MLKAELHTHCSDDPKDFDVSYSAEELIEAAAKQGFDVLAITLHDKLYFPERYRKCAEEHGILLIPGVELRIDGKDVLAYNITEEEVDRVESFEDLGEVKSDDNLFIAAHPYIPFACSLNDSLEEHGDVFDAVEYHSFYFWGFRYWNNKAERVAEELDKPLVGNSDVHELWQLGSTYSLVDAEPTVESFMSAVKQGRVEVRTEPLSWLQALRTVGGYFYRDVMRLLKG